MWFDTCTYYAFVQEIVFVSQTLFKQIDSQYNQVIDKSDVV